MKLSTRGRYGVRIMVDIAMHANLKPVMLRDIAKRQNISEKYVWQLLSPLSKSGLITSIRGARGGYRLGKDPVEITLRDIMTQLEGPLNLVDCVTDDRMCSRAQSCVTRDVWQDISEKINETLERLSLAEMVDRTHEKIGQVNYCI